MQLVELEQLISDNWLLFAVLFIWSLVWKGIALWRAAHQAHRGWFIVLLATNSFGVLDLIYVFFVGRRQAEPPAAV